MDAATLVQILDETVCISHGTMERYISNYSPFSYGFALSAGAVEYADCTSAEG